MGDSMNYMIQPLKQAVPGCLDSQSGSLGQSHGPTLASCGWKQNLHPSVQSPARWKRMGLLLKKRWSGPLLLFHYDENEHTGHPNVAFKRRIEHRRSSLWCSRVFASHGLKPEQKKKNAGDHKKQQNVVPFQPSQREKEWDREEIALISLYWSTEIHAHLLSLLSHTRTHLYCLHCLSHSHTHTNTERMMTWVQLCLFPPHTVILEVTWQIRKNTLWSIFFKGYYNGLAYKYSSNLHLNKCMFIFQTF